MQQVELNERDDEYVYCPAAAKSMSNGVLVAGVHVMHERESGPLSEVPDPFNLY